MGCVLYSVPMNDALQREARWFRLLQQSRMTGLAEVGVAILKPMSPLVAQMLYVAQPVVGVFDRQRDLMHFAALLEDPDAFEQFAERLSASQSKHENLEDN